MIVNYTSCGIYIVLKRQDKEVIESCGILEAKISNRPHQKFTLHLVDRVEEREDLEASGFHIRAIPPRSNWDSREGFEVYLSRENFSLLLDTNRHSTGVGSYISRSRFDRIEFNYFSI